MTSPRSQGPGAPKGAKNRFFRTHKRQKSTVGYHPAKYTAILMLLLTAALAPIPYIGKLAWLIPICTFVIEQKSRYLGEVAVHTGLWTFARGMLLSILELVVAFREWRAYSTQSPAAITAFLTDTRWATAARLMDWIFYIGLVLTALAAWKYRALRFPLLGRLTDRINDVKFPKDPDAH